MSEANGFSNDALDTSNILTQGLTPLSEVENTDSSGELDSSFVNQIEKGLSSLDDLVQNIERLDQSSLADTSELELFAQASPLILDADAQQLEGLDLLTGSKISVSGSAFATATPINLNESIFTNGESTRITLEFIQREAGFRNEVGLYRVDDATGRIGDKLPGDDGYAAAALEPARRIITLDDAASGVQFSAGIETDTLFGSYLIQNDTSQKFLQRNSRNRLNKKPLAFFSFSEGNPDNFDHLQTRVNDSGSIDLSWEDVTGGGDQDFNDAVFTLSFGDAPMDTATPNYAIRAEGEFKLRGRGDYDGDPLDLDDDVLIYAGAGFNLAGRPILPIKRDEVGNPLVDEQNRAILVDDALTVAPGYSIGRATNFIKHQYSGLTPPQMVDTQTVDVPDYSVLKQELLETAIGNTSPEVTLPAFTRLNNASRWASNFPAPGTTDNPTIVRVQRRGLTIPHQVDLSNYVIIVERGDIKFQGSQHELDNVVLVAESGKIDLGQAEVKDSSLLAAKSIKVRSNTNFVGDNLIANSQGKIEFQNSQSELEAEDQLRVIAAGDLSIRGRSTLKGEFLTQQDFLAQGRTSVYGSVGAKGDVTFNGRVEMHAIPSEIEEIRATIDTTSVTEDSGVGIVTVTLDTPPEETVTVDFATRNDTAQAGSDYQEVNGTVSFAPGETVKTIEIPLLNDGIYEANEALVVELTNPQGMILEQESIVVNIINDDPVPEIVIDHPSFIELDTETGNMIFTVSLSNPSSFPVTVDYATEDDTAVAGSDYQAQTGTLTFEPGELEKTIEIPVLGDLEFEPDETFKLSLSNPVNGVISLEDGIGTGTINNDDVQLIELNLNLSNDTGVNNTDNISSDVTVSGTITNQQGEISLSASFDDSNPTDFSDLVQPDGSFTLGREQLQQINGGDLDDGNYTLYLVATDNGSGIVRNSILTFVLDQTAPTLELTTPLVDGDHSSRPRLIGHTDQSNIEGNIEVVSYSLDGELAEVLTVDDNGNFDFKLDEQPLDIGTHSVTVTATDTAGNQSQREVSFQVGDNFFTPNATNGWGAQNDSTLILGEQDSYVVETSIPVALGLETNEDGELVGTRTISFELDAMWDDLDSRGIEDQLLVYLVDPADPSQTLLGNGTEGTAVFSLAGEQSDFTPGLVSFDGRTVTIDASSLTDITEGLLVFQLLNQDDDTGSVVTVNNLASTTDLEGFANPIFPEDNNSVAVGEALNLDNLTETTDVETIIEKVRFDASTGEYRAQVSIRNNGEAAISRNTVVLFNDLPDGVELSSPSGTDDAGNPYLNLRPAILPGGLDLGGVSDVVELVFTNPNLIRFGLNPTVLVGSPNVAPVLEPIGSLTVTPGEKLAIPLTATDVDGDMVTYKLQSDGDLPTGLLEGDGILKFNPKPDEIGSYEFTIIATDGAQEVSQTVTLDVVADSVTTTRISGVIENVEQQPLAGVVIELGDLSTVTNADGSFTIETDQPLTDDTLKVRGEGIEGDQVYPFIAEKLPLVLGQEVYEGYSNVIERPIYLPALDVESGAIIDPSLDVTVTTDKIPGASVFVEAGSLSTQDGEAFTGTLSITEVPRDLTPAALPENLSPDMVVTIQPGEMVFETPAPLSLPNNAGWAAGTEMDLWSINPETGDFDKVGVGRVSDDGSVVETIEGGIRNSSWHLFAPPPQNAGNSNPPPDCEECQAKGNWKSEVELNSGAVIEDYDLVSYASNGESRGISLTYDSLRADPKPIVKLGYENINPSRLTLPRLEGNLRIVADLTVKGNDIDYQVPGGLGGIHFWSIPRQPGDISIALQADLREFESGKYDYNFTNGIYLFIGDQTLGSSQTYEDKLLHVNSIDSAFGSGWGIAGWQEILESSDGSLLLIDGDGSELWFDAPENEGEPYINPPGDFSTLEKLPDGTFRRTMKDLMVYDFNQNSQLASVTDSNGNVTEYVYDGQDRLSKIVDPVRLETVLAYNSAGKVSSIIDPAQRETLMEYDELGNLISITDPDHSSSQWQYDDSHHMIGEIDPEGNSASATYDQFGRARSATQEDGSVVRVNPIETQGLYSPDVTTKLGSAPIAGRANNDISYVDANSNVMQSELDVFGQTVGSVDGGGQTGKIERNQENLINLKTDARGFDTFYTYDEQGNVLTIEDTLTTANNIGNNALIINGIAESSEPELSLSSTDVIDSLLQNSAYQTIISNDVPDNISEYDQIWDIRYDNSSAISEEQTQQYLNFLQTGGNLFLIGENSVFGTRNNSILNLIELAGGGELNFALTNLTQQVLPPFTSPDPVSGNILYEAPGGVTSSGNGQFITIDERERGAGVTFFPGNLENAKAGELTTIFDINFLENVDDSIELQNFLSVLTDLESTSVRKSYTYDPLFNQLTSETDELGRQILYDIDPNNGNLLATTQVVGEVGGEDDVITSYTYTNAGLVDTMTDPLSRVMDYDYDERGNLIKETYAVGTPDEASINYEYDLAGNQTAVIDENGNRSEFEYDDKNRLLKSIYAVGTPDEAVETTEYDRNGNQIATVDGNGNRTEYEYDEKDRLIKIISPDPDGDGELTSPISTSAYDGVGNLVSTTDPLGRETRYIYDSRNRLVETILPDSTTIKSRYDQENNLVGSIDAAGESSRQIYDSRERLIGEIDPQGNVTRYEYDTADQLVAIVDGNGHRTSYEYDELGRQISVTDGEGNVTRTEYDKVGNVVATIDGNKNRTEFEYDERDRNTRVIDAENGTTTTEYDDVGNVIFVTDQLTRTTEYTYDSRNRQTSITDPLTHPTSYQYDDLSNVTKITDANNHSTTFSFDGLNRQIATTNELKDSKTNTYDALGNLTATTDELGRTTTYNYDLQNRQIAVTDPNGNTTKTEYDERGNIIATVDADDNRTEVQYDKLNRQIATVDANEQLTQYEYDAVGNLISITDPEKNITTYTYDKANRRISDTNQLNDSRSYEYDDADNLIKTTDRNGRFKTYSFDKLNRSTTEVWLDENNNPIRTFNYNYDKASQLISVNDSDSAYAYVYDLNGRLIEVDNAGTPGVPNVVFDYDYDPVGNLLSVTDTIDGEVKGTETFTHDELNRVTRITQSGNGVADKRVDMSYDQASQMTGMNRYSDLAGTELVAQSNYTYDEFGRLTDLNHESETDVLANYNWVYDETNRLTQFNSPEGTANYTYDDIDQITGADYDYQEDESYSYDDNGNRTNDGYVTGENNQLLSDGTYNYEYDAEGNRVKQNEIATGDVTEYQWDYRNRLTSVVTFDSDDNVISDSDYTYDAFNRRTVKSVDGDGDGAGETVVERYVLDGEHIALTFDGEGNLTERFLHGTEVDQVIAQENAGSEVLWALVDHQDSVKMLLDNDGSLVSNITYDAFGGITVETNPDVNFRFGYTGREHDDETGLDYYGARYRDSSIGRFISEDTIGFAAGDFNLYRYTFNSPLNYTDPSGNSVLPVVAVGAIAVVGVVGIWYLTNEWLKFVKSPGTVFDRPDVPPTAENPAIRPKYDPADIRERYPESETKPERDKEPKAPYVPNPNEECEETCAKKYPQYDVLTDYIGSQFPFGGFKYDSPSQAANGIQFNRQRHSQIGDPRNVQLGNSAPMNTIFKDREIKFLETLKDPEKSGIHYNIFIRGVQPNQSAGSIGEYKFCVEGKKPRLDEASIILNIKDNRGQKYYQRG